MRTKLRRRIHDEVGDSAGGWSDDELNDELNDAYAWTQLQIFKAFPDAHIFWDYITLTQGVNWYPLGQTFGIHRVRAKLTTTATKYTPLPRKVMEDVEDLESGIATGTYYAQKGQWIGIFPAPAQTVVQGIELLHTPIMAMSTDSELPRIKIPLHEVIVLKAKDSVMGDLDQDAAANRQQIADIIGDMASWYEAMTDTPDRLQPRGL